MLPSSSAYLQKHLIVDGDGSSSPGEILLVGLKVRCLSKPILRSKSGDDGGRGAPGSLFIARSGEYGSLASGCSLKCVGILDKEAASPSGNSNEVLGGLIVFEPLGTPETFDSLPYAEFAVEGELRHEGLSATVDEGKKPFAGGHWVPIGGYR